MKYFDLTLPGHVEGESKPKIHKVDFDTLKRAWVTFPRPLAERLVELGYARWVPCTTDGKIVVPQAFIYPEQIILLNLKTHAVKAAHVYSLVDGVGPIPDDLIFFASNLQANARFSHDPADMVDADEYDALCEDNEEVGLEPEADDVIIFEHSPEDLVDADEYDASCEDDELYYLLEPMPKPKK